MDSDDDLKTAISQPQRPSRFRNLGLALRVFTLCVTISGIVVSAIPSSRNAEAIGILGPATLPTIRPSFSLVIHCFIALGSIACLGCFGWYRDWWPGGNALDDDTEGSEPLFLAALVLACVSTTYQHQWIRRSNASSLQAEDWEVSLQPADWRATATKSTSSRSQSLSTASGAIFVRSNGVRCFYRWQMREAFEAVTAPIKEHGARNGSTNELLHTLDPGIYSQFPEWSTDRQALQTVLHDEACKAGAKVHFGNEIVTVEDDDHAAYASFKNGTRITADLILAADGISSRLRPQVLSHVDPSRLTVIRAPSTHYPTEIPAEMLANDDKTKSLCQQPESENGIMWAGHGGYAIGKYNHHRGLFNIMFSIQHGAADSEASEKKLFDATDDSQVVKSFFSSFNPTVVALANMVQSCSRWRLARLEPLDTWSSPKRRLVLLGDSAHAMLPNLAEGFSSIVEDIDALSILFSESSQDVPKTIETWEKIRIPRVTRLQNGSTWNYKLYNSGKPPGSELTGEQRALSMGVGDGNAPFNTLPFDKWMFDYDTAKEVRLATKAYFS
ncbi:salicylate hydroxylase [Fusarium tjaetaba]|uniref:Salicylate hydroxylase n=1 Tax=Fusarium tjaetaba TaxID=1567544 RepID=A0A8H5QQ41_9HYPO|nr:salicylate hydroxylase [Fusarium tjaetaba]KAF5619287.1 salicylate hydroxylase [Fusarium tjaetaba]